ncbi:DNA repair protein REV1-like [Gigantopelta aegis]|uniref:DNA repair protein REV1-like n=1 Tax=Gigantopelta aegis TaxID=1735272 RepID=UPI001B88B59C|nr:DNA repair protein REV1-like [Gigantopelta aegis]
MSSRGRSSRNNERQRNRGNGFEEWGGYREAKKQKLHEQFHTENKGSTIFKGVAVYINGYTKPSSDELRRLLTLHGGRFEHFLYKKQVTHIVATNLPNSKIHSLKGMKVVRPEWITESVQAQRLLPYTSYLLYGTATNPITAFGKTATHTETSCSDISDNIEVSHSDVPDFMDDATWAHSPLGSDSDTSYESLKTTLVNASSIAESDKETNKKITALHSNDLDDKTECHKNEMGASDMVESNKEMNWKPEESGRVDHKNKTTRPTATASNPGFVSEFYSHSRLHHISTSGAQFKEYVSQLQKQSDGHFAGREALREYHLKKMDRTGSVDDIRGPVHGRPNKVIMHVDMDCFFVSVGLRDRPELIGKPVAVTHSKGKGGSNSGSGGGHVAETTPQQSADNKFSSMAEIASCSYEARKAGVKNGMFMGPALRLCPELVPIPYDFDKYQHVSQTLYDTVASYTHDIEAVSCDEMLIDCTDLLADTGASPLEFATLLREDIKTKTGCNASAGLASSILLARLSTRSAKPNGQFYLESRYVTDFMAKQSVKDLPGVGWSISRKLASLNIKTCGDLQNTPLVTLQKEFGPKTGQNFYKFCRGEDYRQIQMDKERKSVSAEINYGIRFQKDTEAVKFLEELSEEVCNRLKQLNKKGKTITLKLMIRRADAPKETPKYLGHGKCTSFSKSTTLPVSTDDVVTISKQCINMMNSQRIDTTDIRGVGIQMHRLESCSLVPTSGARDTQSILSFAVTQKPSSASDPSTTCVKPSTVPSNSREVAASSVKMTATSSSEQSINEREKQNLDPLEDLTDDDLDDGIRSNNLMDAVESEFTSFLCTTRTILEELSRRKNAKLVAPPLPTLPDMFISPESRRSERGQTKDYFPSPSQIDPEVLKELPPDIRLQVEKDMNIRRCQKDSVGEGETRGNSQEPGCSHWSGRAKEMTNQKTALPDSPQPSLNGDKDSRNTDFEPLPSPSQLDISCLNALPEYLQKEIRQGYAQQNKTIAEPSSPRKGNMLQLRQATSPSKRKPSPTKKRSPVKTASPNKRRKRNSPIFKVPQNQPGRKTKLSAKKLEFTKKPAVVQAISVPISPQMFMTFGQIAFEIYTIKEFSGIIVTIKIGILPQDKKDRNGRLQKKMTLEVCSIKFTTRPSSQEIKPRKCDQLESSVKTGCVEVCERPPSEKLVENGESSPVPQEEDLSVMTSYLGQLIEDRNLEMVDLVLKYLHRKINKLANKLWRISFNKIVSNTQDIVIACYGSCLKTDWLMRR